MAKSKKVDAARNHPFLAGLRCDAAFTAAIASATDEQMGLLPSQRYWPELTSAMTIAQAAAFADRVSTDADTEEADDSVVCGTPRPDDRHPTAQQAGLLLRATSLLLGGQQSQDLYVRGYHMYLSLNSRLSHLSIFRNWEAASHAMYSSAALVNGIDRTSLGRCAFFSSVPLVSNPDTSASPDAAWRDWVASNAETRRRRSLTNKLPAYGSSDATEGDYMRRGYCYSNLNSDLHIDIIAPQLGLNPSLLHQHPLPATQDAHDLFLAQLVKDPIFDGAAHPWNKAIGLEMSVYGRDSSVRKTGDTDYSGQKRPSLEAMIDGNAYLTPTELMAFLNGQVTTIPLEESKIQFSGAVWRAAVSYLAKARGTSVAYGSVGYEHIISGQPTFNTLELGPSMAVELEALMSRTSSVTGVDAVSGPERQRLSMADLVFEALDKGVADTKASLVGLDRVISMLWDVQIASWKKEFRTQLLALGSSTSSHLAFIAGLIDGFLTDGYTELPPLTEVDRVFDHTTAEMQTAAAEVAEREATVENSASANSLLVALTGAVMNFSSSTAWINNTAKARDVEDFLRENDSLSRFRVAQTGYPATWVSRRDAWLTAAKKLASGAVADGSLEAFEAKLGNSPDPEDIFDDLLVMASILHIVDQLGFGSVVTEVRRFALAVKPLLRPKANDDLSRQMVLTNRFIPLFARNVRSKLMTAYDVFDLVYNPK